MGGNEYRVEEEKKNKKWFNQTKQYEIQLTKIYLRMKEKYKERKKQCNKKEFLCSQI